MDHKAMHTIKIGLGLNNRHGAAVDGATVRRATQLLGDLLSELFYGCTIFTTEGYWLGQIEKSLIFEALTDAFDPALHYPLLVESAARVAELAEQEAVMLAVFETPGSLEMIGAHLAAAAA